MEAHFKQNYWHQQKQLHHVTTAVGTDNHKRVQMQVHVCDQRLLCLQLQQRHILFFHVNGLGLLKKIFFFLKDKIIAIFCTHNIFQCTVFSAKIVTKSVMFTFDMSLTRYFLFVAGRLSCTEMGSVFLFLHALNFYLKVRISQTKFDLLL